MPKVTVPGSIGTPEVVHFDGMKAHADKINSIDDNVIRLLQDWHREDMIKMEKQHGGNAVDWSKMYPKVATDRRKFVSLDTGGSGAFLLDRKTGEIYCIKGYGVPHYKKMVGKLGEVTGKVLVEKRFWYLK